MMVQTPVLVVVFGTPAEIFEVSCWRIHSQIVKLQNFGEVSQVSFKGIVFVVADHMLKRGVFTPVVEHIAFIRHNDYYTGSGFGSPDKFLECLDGIGDVFEVVGGQDEIIAFTFDAGHIYSISNVYTA